MKHSLSIITVNFNNKIGLKRTISSVIGQSYRNLQYVIVDGGSTDGSKELIESHSEKIDCWVSEKDDGIYDAMNKGIQMARGRYLLFLNSGDVLTADNILEYVFANIGKINSDIIYTDILIGVKKKSYPEKISLSFLFKTSLCHQSTLIKKDIFKEFGLYDLRYNLVADWFLLLRCYLSSTTFTYLPNILLVDFDNTGVSASYEVNQIQRKKALAENYPNLLTEMADLKELSYFRSSRIHHLAERLKAILRK